MSFLDIQFPSAISFHAVGGPGFLTNVVIANSGQEFRDQVWSLERGSWEVSHAARLPTDYKPLQAFFRIARGRANSFRFKDWSDFAATSSEGVFTMLTSTTFQAWKRYTFGGQTFDRKITKLVATPTTTGGTVSSWALTTGIVTMTTGTPTAWAAEFDCHCRFDTDQMKAETIDKSGRELLIGWSSIPVIEVR
jgi:uncharacterized protein (TIGR02217 family)